MTAKLIVGDGNSIFVKDLIANLKKTYPETRIDCLSIYEPKSSIEGVDFLYQTPITYRLKGSIGPFKWGVWSLEVLWLYFFRQSKIKYDVVQIHSVNVAHLFSLFIYKKVSKKVVSVLWGSDILRCRHRQALKWILEQSDGINCATKELYDSMVSLLGGECVLNKVVTQNIFGLSPLDKIKYLSNQQEELLHLIRDLGLDKEKVVVTIGHNATEGQQHIDIIDSLDFYSFQNVLFVFPFTYGGSDVYISKVKNKLIESNIEYVILEKFLSENELAALRIATDIFIQLQITDALSGSMQEHLYSKNTVITGKWLGYSKLKDLDVSFLEVNSVSEIGLRLFDELHKPSIEATAKELNQQKIYELSAWSNVIRGWNEL